ncbi:MAG: hypothetical protein GY703_01365 [Gammaproteobacteria bacterium]|nr:hypothetical protein [Gammaproteobacteria bacterium]
MNGLVLFLLFWSLYPWSGVQAAQQFDGLCSYVKIEIRQELALERVAFEATLEITNNEGDASITDFSALLTFQTGKEDFAVDGEDASDLFFVQPPVLNGIEAIDGSGVIRPGETAVVTWLIIPKISAGGEDASGLQYSVGARLAGSLYGKEIAPEILVVIPDTITVKPEPQLNITYFQPRDVDGDDPFTPDVVESPIPFTLGVLVRNDGYGPAKSVRINSEQPRIVENLQEVLVIPRLLGSRVDDEPTDYASLKVDLGDIQPGGCRKGAWDMMTTLSGEFTEFRASYTHASELGGDETSLIKSLEAHFISHEVLNDQPGRDQLLDFLADTIHDENREIIPDTLFESDCNTLPVNRLLDVEVLSYDPQTLTAQVRAAADFENWVIIRLDDPGQAKLKIESIVRSDGKVLNPNNYWTHVRYRKPDNAKLTWLNIFDFVALGEYTYEVVYDPPGSDIEAPETVLRFNNAVQEKDGKFYILPETQMFFTVEDESPVGTWYRLGGSGDFLPAYPFSLDDFGEYAVEYYSQDSAGNAESYQVATLVLSEAYPGIQNLTLDSSSLFIAGDAVSIRPIQVMVGFQGIMTAARLDGIAEVFRGVYGFPTLSGVPSTPSAQSDASLNVGGEQVDFYRYRINEGAWSGEAGVAEPLLLNGLSGPVELEVLGRSGYGDYPPEDQALVVSWTVGSASAIRVTETPESPGNQVEASLNVTGNDFYCYRLDGSFYQPNLVAGASIELAQLEPGEHLVEVIGRGALGDVCPESTPGEASVSWTVDHDYGYELPGDQRVRHEDLGQVDDTPSHYAWDGRDENGVVVEPGWYSVRVSLTDGLGRTTAAIKQVEVGDMLAGGSLLSGPGNAVQQHARSFGEWVVWQDQVSGNWDIWGKNLLDPTGTPIQLTDGLLNQERPATDGRYLVWQDRQLDGTWDIWMRNLTTEDPAAPVTATSAFDEQKPVIDWPWVVFQRKPVANPNAPWQLFATNLLDGQTEAVDTTTQDQLDGSIHRQRVVWQDFRDVGAGEIYMKDLRTGQVQRITENTGGQYHPDIFDHWVVWADNRQGLQLDLYGHNLRRGVEVQLTDTPEDENWPSLNGSWVVYEEDASGEQKINLRLLHLGNLASVQLTNSGTLKEQPSQAGERLVWVDAHTGVRRVMQGPLPDLQPVFHNYNTVAVTQGMVDYQADAFSLLELWHEQAGVTEIVRYSSLLPTPIAETVSWSGAPTGDNFDLTAGSFLWVKFADTRILELGQGSCGALNLPAGTTVFSFGCFPDHYSAYQMIQELGTDRVAALRVLNSKTGQWQVANVQGDTMTGEDFRIPTLSVVMLELQAEVTDWVPGD